MQRFRTMSKFLLTINQFDATSRHLLHRTIDGVVDGPYTTAQLEVVPGRRRSVVAFVRRKGNTYFLVHNVRRQGKVQQLQLARLGERPRITDDVVRTFRGATLSSIWTGRTCASG